jgi:hypothetical protein
MSLPRVIFLFPEDFDEEEKTKDQKDHVQNLGKDVIVPCDQVQEAESQGIERWMIDVGRISREMDVGIGPPLGDGFPEDQIGRIVPAREEPGVERENRGNEHDKQGSVRPPG